MAAVGGVTEEAVENETLELMRAKRVGRQDTVRNDPGRGLKL